MTWRSYSDGCLRATPQADGTVAFTLAASPYQPAPDLVFTWELPDGGELLDGPADGSAGAVAARGTVQQSRRVRFPGPGTYAVRAVAAYRPEASVHYSAAGVLFVTVDATGGITISDQDARLPVYTRPRVKPTLDKSDRVVAADADMTTDGCFYVTGILTRNERAPSVNTGTGAGFYTDQGGSARPVHHMLVEMREEDTFSDDSYGYTVTNDNGKFEFRFCDDDGFLDDELELYFRVCAEVWDGPDKIARISNIDDRDLYCFDSRIIESEGGTVDFDLAVYDKNSIEAAVFNIGDAIYYAWRFWNDNASASPRYDRTANVLWQRGAKRTGSFYNDDQSIMVIADDPSSTDEWDDSVIIHEWGHFADHQFSCNQNPGGAHSLPGINNGANGLQLSWGEGYPDYYQSAVRTVMPGAGFTSYYIDPDGPTVDLEVRPGQASDRNEGAIAALMWDFADGANDGQDTVNHGHAALQRVLTDPGFRNNTQCDMRRFLKVWKDLGLPADAATAATVVQNVNVNLSSVAAVASSAPDAATQPVSTAATNAGAGPLDYRWWDQVTMVVDNSTSMAGGAGIAKLDAVKQTIAEQVNDYTRAPQGTEFNVYTFNADSPPTNTVLEGRFFADTVNAGVNGIAAAGADDGCYLDNALAALQHATTNKAFGNAWLYTDGDTYEGYRVNAVRQHLASRGLRGSTVLLGGCGSPATAPTDITGGEKSYLELAADGSQPSGMVPYLLTALGTGGQFLYVAPDQLADAVAVLRAQLSHTAGAGRWSDYVSDTFTYRYDQLQSFEYQWFPAESLGQDMGQLEGDKRITLPNPFSFYGETTDTMDVSPQGVIRADPCVYANPEFCPILSSTKHIDVLNGNLQWSYIAFPPRAAAAATDAPDTGAGTDEYGTQVHLYTANFGIDEWFIISTQGTGYYGVGDYAYRAYQVWLNFQTGEIRFQYGNVRDEAGTSQIGLRYRNEVFDIDYGSVIVSKDKLGGAYSGMGYKFTPAPPQPTKTYVVKVDPLIDSVVFLQTGYSGSFEPMVVRYPDGTPVDCNDTANVQCVSLNGGLVQFVQVNTNGVGGEYQALIDAGPTGSGTFSFNAMASSPVGVTGLGQYARSFTPQRLLFDFGRSTDDGLLTGWFQRTNGAQMGDQFMFYDDGAHDDGDAGDGRFGSDPYVAPERVSPISLGQRRHRRQRRHAQQSCALRLPAAGRDAGQTRERRLLRPAGDRGLQRHQPGRPALLLLRRLRRAGRLGGYRAPIGVLPGIRGNALLPGAGDESRRRPAQRHQRGRERGLHRGGGREDHRRRDGPGAPASPARGRRLRQSLGGQLSAPQRDRRRRHDAQSHRRLGADHRLDRPGRLPTEHHVGDGQRADRCLHRRPAAGGTSPRGRRREWLKSPV
ncbi:MAG: hypothetical protein H6644_07190 [Caldilineaceae bacterium]|nr:hypothetical protein [Caldilineaceae bacterium]